MKSWLPDNCMNQASVTEYSHLHRSGFIWVLNYEAGERAKERVPCCVFVILSSITLSTADSGITAGFKPKPLGVCEPDNKT